MSATKRTILAVIVFATLLGSQLHSEQISPLCGKFDREKLKDPPDELRFVAAAENCAHHTAATLASGPDTADVIAAAVADVCFTEINDWANQQFKQNLAGSREQATRAARAEVIGQARLEVLRDRAGHCPSP